MGNLILTTSELDPGEERSTRNLRSVGKASPKPLELISKPLLSTHTVPDEPLWRRLGSNLRDAFFARKLPPLELASRPIAVADPLAVRRDPVSSAISFLLHVGIFALIVWFGFQTHKQIVEPKHVVVAIPIYVKPYIPVVVPAPTIGGGGGGGEHQVVAANKGHLPPIAKTQIVPVQMLTVDHPKLAAAPSVVMPQSVKIPMNRSLPNFGMTQSTQVALVSHGSGNGASFGQGHGGGFGSGMGAGVGPGTGGGYGGVMSVGGGVAAPQVIHSVEPQFSDAARNAKYQGTVSIQLIVDPQGNPQDIHVIRHLGMGLDAKAIEAIRQYKFKPAMYQGHPVPVQMVIDVAFHLD